MNHECQELKNIKYQTMLLTGADKIKEQTKDLENNDKINEFLNKEKTLNTKEVWNKLNKTTKIKLLYDYAENYGVDNELSHIQVKSLKTYLKNCLERKQLQNVKDVVYNKDEQIIVSIPNLQIKDKKFTLKRNERRPSTLKSLAPIKSKKSKKKRETSNEDNNK
ncbi:MAG: hypothetical protein CMF80_06810 [Candidatus Marinimicrobia bacterium]|nr:hypothetical protein [Candidatus Neomarinimicrobiota bacterium]|tara:strand:- start:280 stop:771 length:492 start_codon:yes stop_codon:yes gene_type:complete